MNASLREWLDKAEEDRRAMAGLRTLGPGLANTICFHAQQCVEKLMKAALLAAAADAPKTHDLAALSARLEKVYDDWSWDERELEDLIKGGVQFRYPGEDATEQEADAAADICERIRPRLLALIPA